MTSAEAGRARILDANLNRMGEGLRVLEDISRLLLNDAVLSGKLKALRHRLLESDIQFHQGLLQARDAAGDVGATLRVPGQDEARELPLVVAANSRRAQESLRVIEELAKAPGEPELDPARFQEARFELYSIERGMLSRLLREEKRKRLSGLYVLIGSYQEGIIAKALSAGAAAIELKPASARETLQNIEQIRSLSSGREVLVIVNDRADLAVAAKADGVRLEAGSLPLAEARSILGIEMLAGFTADTPEQALGACEEGADYLVVSGDIGIEAIRGVKRAVSVPVVAVAFGGVIGDNIAEIRAAGADAIAIHGSSLDTVPAAWFEAK